jgi:hypothetical protein
VAQSTNKRKNRKITRTVIIMVKIELMKFNKLWPKQKTVPRKKVEAASIEFSIGPYDKGIHGFPVSKLVGSTWRHHMSIPPRYRHALRFLNFKDACYIAALGIDVGEIDVESENGEKWATMRDGMSRNLVFDAAVRMAFFDDVQVRISNCTPYLSR